MFSQLRSKERMSAFMAEDEQEQALDQGEAEDHAGNNMGMSTEELM
jgi:hypothetical protein